MKIVPGHCCVPGFVPGCGCSPVVFLATHLLLMSLVRNTMALRIKALVCPAQVEKIRPFYFLNENLYGKCCRSLMVYCSGQRSFLGMYPGLGISDV